MTSRVLAFSLAGTAGVACAQSSDPLAETVKARHTHMTLQGANLSMLFAQDRTAIALLPKAVPPVSSQ